MTTAWERLNKVIEWQGMTPSSFARHIGMTRAEVIYQIKFGKMGISLKFAQRIASYFPQISVGWLVSGEGTMFLCANGNVPCFATINDICDANAAPEMHFGFPNMSSCCCAYRNADEALGDRMLPGEVVFLAKTALDKVTVGELYVVEHSDFVILRLVVGIEDNVIRLAVDNPPTEPMELSWDDVKNIYRVVGRMTTY